MGKKIKIFNLISLALFILVLFFFVYSVFNYKIMHKEISDRIETYVARYGYAAVFLLSFLLEISPRPFISALAPLASGLAVNMDYHFLTLIVILSATLSGLVGYFAGIIYGKNVILQFIKRKDYTKYKQLFKKYGNFAFSIAALTPIPYFPILAGAFRMKFTDFAIYALFFRALHFLILSWLLFVVLT